MGAMSAEGGMEVLQYVSTLQAAGLDHGQNPFHESATRRAPTAKAAFPPQYRPTQQAFHEVVGWFYSFDARERPQRGLQRQHMFTEGRDLFVLAKNRAFQQQTLQAIFQRLQLGLQLYPRDLSFLKRLPRGKNFFD